MFGEKILALKGPSGQNRSAWEELPLDIGFDLYIIY
jgi:hypothetical protein